MTSKDPIPGYVGFEAAAVFSEEARAPGRTAPVAVYSSLALIGAAYALSSWAMSVHYGDDQVAAVAGQQGPGMSARPNVYQGIGLGADALADLEPTRGDEG